MTGVGVRYMVDTLSFAPLATCPLCRDDLDIHEWFDMTGVVPTSASGDGSGEVVACDRVVCRWFARCENYATHAEQHPVLGPVPACDRCPNVGNTRERNQS